MHMQIRNLIASPASVLVQCVYVTCKGIGLVQFIHFTFPGMVLVHLLCYLSRYFPSSTFPGIVCSVAAVAARRVD